MSRRGGFEIFNVEECFLEYNNNMRNRIRQGVKWYTVIPALGGVGMFIVGLILPYANVNISQSIARIFLFIGFVLIVLSFVAGILRFFLINQNMSSDTRDKYSTLYDIIPILRKMDRHLWGIAERQKIVNINIYKFNRTASKINELMDVKTGTLDPKKLMEGWLEYIK